MDMMQDSQNRKGGWNIRVHPDFLQMGSRLCALCSDIIFNNFYEILFVFAKINVNVK